MQGQVETEDDIDMPEVEVETKPDDVEKAETSEVDV